MLSFAEEILLLALNDKKGRLYPLPDTFVDYALAGAILMELAFEGRIDTDVTNLIVLDSTSTGNTLRDEILQRISSEYQPTIQQCLEKTARKAADIKEKTFQDLVEKNILLRKEKRYFWVYNYRRYPVINDSEEKEVKARIREIILTEAIPHPRDVVLICLMDACGLSATIFTQEELKKVSPRIKLIAKMDFIGQAITKSLARIQHAILEAMGLSNISNFV